MTTRAVIDSLRRLEQSKVIQRTRGIGKHNVYEITPEDRGHRWIGTSEVASLVKSVHYTSEVASPKPVKSLHPNKSNEQEYVTRVGGARKTRSSPRSNVEASHAKVVLRKCKVIASAEVIDLTSKALGFLAEDRTLEEAARLMETRMSEAAEQKANLGQPFSARFWLEDRGWASYSRQEIDQIWARRAPRAGANVG